jgi:hypothetical protein
VLGKRMKFSLQDANRGTEEEGKEEEEEEERYSSSELQPRR